MYGQGELFDPTEYTDIRVESLGEQPAMTAQEWLEIADQMHDEANWPAMDHAVYKYDQARLFDNGLNNYSRMIGRAIVSGEITPYDGYIAIQQYE